MQLLSLRKAFHGPADRPHCCFPSVCRIADRGQLISWRIGSEKDSEDGTICFIRSEDWGDNQGKPLMPFDRRSTSARGTFELDGVPGSLHFAALTTLPDGRVMASIMWLDRSVPDRPMFNDQTDGLVRIETLVSYSSDHGATWSEPHLLDASPYQGLAGVCAPALVLPNGRLAAQLEVNKRWDDSTPWQQRAILKFSDDAGQTWPVLSQVAYDPATRIRYWDQRHAVAPDGTMVAGLWVFDTHQRKEVNFHLTDSVDGGRTWSPPRDSGYDYQLPYPVFLPDGRLVVFVIDRYRTRTIRALISEDRGRTFASEELVVYQHGQQQAGQDQHQISDQQMWSFGRVEAVAIGERRVGGVFYAGDASQTAIYLFTVDCG